MRKLLFLLPLMALASCFNNYYSSQNLKGSPDPDAALQQLSGKKVFIHFSDRTLLAEHLSDREGTLTAYFRNPRPESSGFEMTDHAEGLQEVGKKDKEELESHLHLFCTGIAPHTGAIVSLPAMTITNMRQHHYEAGLTLGGQVLGMMGILALVTSTLLLLFALLLRIGRSAYEIDLNTLHLFK